MNRQETEHFARQYGFLVVFCLVLVLFLFPVLLRVFNDQPITPGASSYSYLRLADMMRSGAVSYDSLHQTSISPNPYVFMLAILQLFGVPWLLPCLLGILFLLLLEYELLRVIHSHLVVILTLLIVAISPNFSVLLTHHTVILLCMVLLLAAMLLVHDHSTLAAVSLFFAIVTFPPLGLLGFAGFAVYLRRNKHTLVSMILAVLVSMAWVVFWTGGLDFSGMMPHFSAAVIFEFGNSAGISAFLLIMAIYGGILRVEKDLKLIVATTVLLVAMFILPFLIPVTVVLCAILAAHAIFTLMFTKWELDLLQTVFLWVLFCIGLFLVIVAIRERASEMPDADIAHLMVTLRNEQREGSVLSMPDYAPFIEYYSGRKAAASPETPPDVVHALFFERDSNLVYKQFLGSDTAYVIITEDMRENFFTRSDEGLLFFLENSERFTLIEKTDHAELWYFIRKT